MKYFDSLIELLEPLKRNSPFRTSLLATTVPYTYTAVDIVELLAHLFGQSLLLFLKPVGQLLIQQHLLQLSQVKSSCSTPKSRSCKGISAESQPGNVETWFSDHHHLQPDGPRPGVSIPAPGGPLSCSLAPTHLSRSLW